MSYFIFNLVEGCFWIGLGAWAALKKQIPKSSSVYGFAVTLVSFGLSDFAEMTTGAWWRPWWLLVWKALCLLVGIILIIFIFRERRSP